MTEAEILDMAREAGLVEDREGFFSPFSYDENTVTKEDLARFGNLVAAHTKQCDGCGKTGAAGWALYCVKCLEPVKQASVDFLQHDDHLRFIQRVLESNAPYEDRARAAQMVRDIRRSIRPLEKP
jgi:hypothetical protein